MNESFSELFCYVGRQLETRVSLHQQTVGNSILRCVLKVLGVILLRWQADRNSIRRCDLANFRLLFFNAAGSYKLNLNVRFGQFFGVVSLRLQAVINSYCTCT